MADSSNRDAATASRPAPANGADGADQQLFPILDRSSNQKIMVDAVRYEEERVHLARLPRYGRACRQWTVPNAQYRPHMRPALLRSRASATGVAVFGAIAACTIGLAGPVTAATSTPSVTIDVKALGTGGGAFCDGARKQLIAAVKSDVSAAMMSGDTAKIKAYYEKAGSETAKLLALAPSEIKSALVLTSKTSTALGEALKKAGYDFKKLDPKAMQAAAKPDAAATAAQATVNAYLKNTCHMDLAKAMGLAQLAPTTTKKK